MRSFCFLVIVLGLGIFESSYLCAEEPMQPATAKNSVHTGPHIPHLILSCGDGRFIHFISQWAERELTHGHYDELVIPGSCQSLNDVRSQHVVLDYISKYIRLHGTKTLHIFCHHDCGAYGGSSTHQNLDAEFRLYQDEMTKAAQLITDKFQLQVRLYIADFTDFDEASPRGFLAKEFLWEQHQPKVEPTNR